MLPRALRPHLPQKPPAPQPRGSRAHLLVLLIQILQEGVQLILIDVATSVLVAGRRVSAAMELGPFASCFPHPFILTFPLLWAKGGAQTLRCREKQTLLTSP